MKKIILTVIIVLCCVFASKAQQSISDTTIVMGMIDNGLEGAYLGTSTISYCELSLDRKVSNYSIVFVIGYKHCDDTSVLKKDQDYFEVVYKGKIYMCPKGVIRFIKENDYMSEIKKFTPEQYERFRAHSIDIANEYHKLKINQIYGEMDGCKTKGLSLMKYNVFDVSEYTDGTGIDFEVYNPTNKIIKYLWFSVVGYNAVDDIVRKGTLSTIKLKAVGPIKPKESATYSYDYVWFSDLVESAKVSSITVMYMDGTSKIINPVKNIMLAKIQYKYLND